jgi:hypothetical protein
MEHVHESLISWALPDVAVVPVNVDFNAPVVDKFIYVCSDIFKECPCPNEMLSALRKRLITNDLYNLALCCIASYRYTTNQNNVSKFVYKDFMNVWGHIDTLSRSSSPRLSSWMAMVLGDRSQIGYERAFRENFRVCTEAGPRNKVRFKSDITRVSVSVSDHFFGPSSTINEAAISDAKMLSIMRLIGDQPILENEVIGVRRS